MKAHQAVERGNSVYQTIIRQIDDMKPTRYSVQGMPDILGFVTYNTPSGKPWARTLAIECKGKKGKATPEQEAWGVMCEERGGIWILAYSIKDVVDRLSKEGFDV
jgi:hypothetical protein